MPVYVYRVLREGPAGAQPETFEIRQSIHDAALTSHPVTGEPVRRVPCVPQILRGALSNSTLNAAGFTKYVKSSDGTYEKQAGAGPGRVDPHGDA
jgi:predicted nucleic acid-binding Zn ribbon protein